MNPGAKVNLKACRRPSSGSPVGNLRRSLRSPGLPASFPVCTARARADPLPQGSWLSGADRRAIELRDGSNLRTAAESQDLVCERSSRSLTAAAPPRDARPARDSSMTVRVCARQQAAGIRGVRSSPSMTTCTAEAAAFGQHAVAQQDPLQSRLHRATPAAGVRLREARRF